MSYLSSRGSRVFENREFSLSLRFESSLELDFSSNVERVLTSSFLLSIVQYIP